MSANADVWPELERVLLPADDLAAAAEGDRCLHLADVATGPLGIIGRAALTKQSCLVPNVGRDTDYIAVRANVVAQVATPIMIGSSVIGVISLEHGDRPAFDDTAQAALESLAATAAVTLQRVRLTRAITKILSAADTHDVKGVLEIVLERCLRLSACSLGAIGLVDGDGRVEFLVREGGMSTGVAAGGGMTARVVETKQLMAIPDVTRQTGYLSLNTRVRSELLVPVLLDSAVVGIIYLQSTLSGHFSDENLITITLRTLAEQVALALRTLRQRTIAASMPQVARDLSTLHAPDQVAFQHALWTSIWTRYGYDTFPLSGKPFSGVSGFSFVQRTPDGGVLSTWSQRAHYNDQLPHEFAAWRVPTRHARVLTADEAATLMRSVPLQAYRSHLVAPVPVPHHAAPDAWLLVHAARADAFEPSDVLLLQNVAEVYAAQRAKLAVEHQLLTSIEAFSQIERGVLTDGFYESAETVETARGIRVVPTEVWRVICENASTLTGAPFCSFFILHHDRLEKIMGRDPGADAGAASYYAKGERLELPLDEEWATARAVRSRQAVYEQRYTLSHDPTIKSILAVPIFDEHDELLGAINVRSDREDAFGEHHKLLLAALAGQAHLTQTYADLFDKVHRLITITHRITDTYQDEQEVATLILVQAVDLLGGAKRGLRGVMRRLNVARNSLDLMVALPADPDAATATGAAKPTGTICTCGRT